MRDLPTQKVVLTNPDRVIETGSIRMDLDSQTISVSGDQTHLTDKEFQVLAFLLQHKGTLVTRRMFFDHLYDGVNEPNDAAIVVYMNKIRKKLKGKVLHGQIKTVAGRGHVWIEQTPEPPRKRCEPLHRHTDENLWLTINLTGMECKVLSLLLQRKGTVVSKQMFLNHLYKDTDVPAYRVIDVFINKIRKKLKGKIFHGQIKTVVGRGHVWIEQTLQLVESDPVETRTSNGPRIRHNPWYGLPCVSTTYWLADRKQLIIEAIVDDTRPEITIESVMNRYGLGLEELWEWFASFERKNIEGLKVTKMQTDP